MKHFIAEGRPQYKLSQLIDKGITWTEYRVWRTIYEVLAEGQECYWKTDSEGAEVCGMNRPQYINAIKGLVEKGIVHSLGEGQYVVTFKTTDVPQSYEEELPVLARKNFNLKETLHDNYSMYSNDDDNFPFQEMLTENGK